MTTIRAKVRFLATDIFDAPDDHLRYEVIDGWLYMTPPPSWGHQFGVSELHLHVGSWVKQHNLGVCITAPTGVVLDEENGVEPDLLFIARDRFDIIADCGVNGAPDLMVEVLSPRTAVRDRGIKFRRYAAAGVRYYWIVDVANRTLEEYRLGTTGFELVTTVGADDVLRPELFPGLEIPVNELWA